MATKHRGAKVNTYVEHNKMLNNEAGKANKPIRMDSNIFLDASIWVGAIVSLIRDWYGQSSTVYSNHLQTVQKIKINHPRSTRLINAEKIKE